MGLDPKFWGPHVWAAIHLICLGAPESFTDNQLNYRKFIESLPGVLPCEACRQHLVDNLKATPMDAALAGGKHSLFVWSVKLHNTVNKMLNKPEMSVEDAYKHWTNVANGVKSPKKDEAIAPSSYEKNVFDTKTIIMVMFLFVLIICVLLCVKIRMP
jgi:hypothetical protein